MLTQRERLIHGCVVVVFLFLVAACAGRWQTTTPDRVKDPTGNVSVRLPPGWIRDNSREHAIVVTRQGLPLQTIVVAFERHGDANTLVGRFTRPGVRLGELQRALRDALGASEEGESAVEVVESTSMTLAGRPAARLLVRRESPAGITYRHLAVAAGTEDGVVRISYETPKIHYFQQDLEHFESLVASARLRE